MFVRVVVPGKMEYRLMERFGGTLDEWGEHSNKVVASVVKLSEEHPTIPRLFVDPTGRHFSVHKSKGALALTRTEVYENE